MSDVSHHWRRPPDRLTLHPGEVHIWRAALEPPAVVLARFRDTLSAEERERADRFYFESDRVRFIAAHGVLRGIVGRYCDVDPAAVRLRTGPHGKPELVPMDRGDPSQAADADSGANAGGRATRFHGKNTREPVGAVDAEEPIQFNMSHSHRMGLYAVTSQRAVGIDIEHIRMDFECEKIAGRFFHERETDRLRGLSPGERREAFFQYWTCKEAYIKGRGKGLSIPTRSFSVEIMPSGRATVTHADEDSSDASRWKLVALEPAPGYAGAVAVEGEDPHLVFWHW